MFGFFKSKVADEMLKEISFYSDQLGKMQRDGDEEFDTALRAMRGIWDQAIPEVVQAGAFQRVAALAMAKGLEAGASDDRPTSKACRRIIAIWLRSALMEDKTSGEAHTKAVEVLRLLEIGAPPLRQ
ncbi:MAG: hypothetical protein O9309_18620 [Rhizobium sp.]|nr:hypothetical protein [Rhizobium sp.]MCZ8351661.1 hypothetical protein [Rhizobium sp.]